MSTSGSLPQSEQAATGPLPPARLGSALRQGLRDIWDRLGLVLGMSLTGTLLLTLAFALEKLVPRSAPILLHLGTVSVLLLALLVAPLGGAFHIAHRIATQDEVSYGLFWQSALRYYRSALLLAGCDLLAIGGLSVNVWFYARLGHVTGMVTMLLCLYLLLFWCLMAQYHFPLLVVQETGVFDRPDRPARRGTVAILRRAFFLTLGRPFYTLGLFAVVLPITLLCMLSGVLFALLWLGVLSLLLTHATRALLVQFDVLPPPPTEEEVVPDLKFKLVEKSQ